MKTPWTNKVGNIPLDEYPRPQMVRDNWKNLNGVWEYAITQSPQEPEAFQGEILVPFAVESSLSGVKKIFLPKDYLWYRRNISQPVQKGKRYILHFDAVDWESTIWVNGIEVCRNRGGYLPFSCDITHALTSSQRECTHEITVMVQDPTDDFWQQKGKQALKPYSCFYTASSGIWQTVWLEEVPSSYICDLKITPDVDTSTVRFEPVIDISPATSDDAGYSTVVSVFQGGSLVGTEEGCNSVTLHIDNPELWSPDNPHLYDCTVDLLVEGVVVDRVSSYFGMRKFHMLKDETGIPRFAINNKILFLHGPLDQGYYPDGLYTAPSEEAIRFDLEQMKALEFNMVRKHIKVEPLRWYYWCDKLGLIVIQDMINGGKPGTSAVQYVKQALTKDMRGSDTTKGSYRRNFRPQESREQFEEELYQMVDHLYNITSIGMWVPFNECWGQFDAARIAKDLKAYDSTRLIDHASGWLDQGVGDFVSFHRYNKPLYNPKHRNGRGVFLSEYGGYTLSIPNHIWTDKVFGYGAKESQKELNEAYSKLIQEELLPLKDQGCCAAVYTQWTDVEKEINGFYTYDRKVLKFDADLLRKMNRLLIG